MFYVLDEGGAFVFSGPFLCLKPCRFPRAHVPQLKLKQGKSNACNQGSQTQPVVDWGRSKEFYYYLFLLCLFGNSRYVKFKKKTFWARNILVPKGRAPFIQHHAKNQRSIFSEHAQSNPFLFSANQNVRLDSKHELEWREVRESRTSGIGRSLFPQVPEVAIFGADQQYRSLWEREWRTATSSPGVPFFMRLKLGPLARSNGIPVLNGFV